MDHKAKGKIGENLARKYLESNGFEVLESNYRYLRGEIDLITLWQNELLVFVEVKARSNLDFGDPESFVSPGQERLILQAAEEYIFAINWKKDIRFDIIAIDLNTEKLEHFPDAFY
jgi:putative endonuclease